jgi:hypothetical protein
MSKEAMKLALAALENAEDQLAKPYSTGARYAITALREALAEQPACEHEWLRGGCLKCGQSIEQPAQQEQLREENERLHVENRRLIDRIETIGVSVGVGGIATTTAQRTWVGLTDEERMDVLLALNWDKQLTHMDTAKAIEAKLKEKNT